MAAPAELAAKFRSALEPYIKPREQVNYIRRILALHLRSCLGDDAADQPLSAVDSTRHVDADDGAGELQGVYKEYAAAVQAHAAARRQFDAALQTAALDSRPCPAAASSESDFLDEHLALLRLRQKRDCLAAIHRSLDRLAENPASGQDPMDVVFGDAVTLPNVPASVVNSLVSEKSGQESQVKIRAHQLERAILRAKIQSKQEKRLLVEAKARCKGKSQTVTNGARVEALSATRNELISWIEAELSKASAAEAERGGDDVSRGLAPDQRRPKQP